METALSDRTNLDAARPLAAELAVQLAQAATLAEPLEPLLGIAADDGPLVLDPAAQSNLQLPFAGQALEQAWQGTLVELLTLADSGVPAELLLIGDSRLDPAAAAPVSEPRAAEAAAQPEPTVAPDDHAIFAPQSYEILPLPEPRTSLMSLQETDLFGEDGPAQLFELDEQPLGVAGNGFDFDLFGGAPPGDILTAAMEPNGQLILVGESAPPGPVVSPGLFDLTQEPVKVTITPEVAAANADAGYLLVQGDGDDTVVLEGGWLDIAPYGSGLSLYQSFDGLYTVEIQDATVFQQLLV